MEREETGAGQNASANEKQIREELFDMFRNCPIPENEMLSNLPLFIKRQDLSRILFINELYSLILGVHGSVVEFGVRWGHNLALFESLRGIYEPFNHNRLVVGFDTFSGFPSVHPKDGTADIVAEGALSVTEGYECYLEQVLAYHEKESPISHRKKFSLIKGDAVAELDKYLDENSQTIFALAYFDFDLYEPTKHCLERIKEHITKGTVIGFDQLNYGEFPGETVAVREVLGLAKYRINHSKFSPTQSYIVIE